LMGSLAIFNISSIPWTSPTFSFVPFVLHIIKWHMKGNV
jgi:hypothetical protein